MEEKNDLNDILLQQEDEEKNDKSKLILIAAAVLIVFFLGVIGYKIFTDTTGKSKALPTSTNIGAKSDGYSKVDVSKEEFKLPSEEEKKSNIDKKISDIKKSYTKEVEKAKQTAPKPKPTPAPVAKKPEPKKEAPKKILKPATKEVKKDVKQPVSTTTSTRKDKFYIQVGSYKSGPNKEIVKAISTKGYVYKLRDMKNPKDGKIYTRLYVGPYKNKIEAVSALIKVKKDLGLDDSAFVIRDY